MKREDERALNMARAFIVFAEGPEESGRIESPCDECSGNIINDYSSEGYLIKGRLLCRPCAEKLK